MAYKRQIDRLPIPPKDAKVHNVTCHYCIVGCGYKAYTWDRNKQGTLTDNAFGMAGLDDRVTFQQANALELPFVDGVFDVVISQEAFCHIPDKDRLVAQCARVLKPGGRVVFTDILATGSTTDATRQRLQQEMTFIDLGSHDTYRRQFQREACAVVEAHNVSDQWRDILIDRLAMYRSLKDQTIDRFGAAHFTRWDNAYSFFVGLYATGELGGGRFLARREAG